MSDDVSIAADYIRNHRGVTLGSWLCACCALSRNVLCDEEAHDAQVAGS